MAPTAAMLTLIGEDHRSTASLFQAKGAANAVKWVFKFVHDQTPQKKTLEMEDAPNKRFR